MEGKNISVIIACYNEQKNIVETIKRVHKTLPKAEIVVVDDGSKDKTAEVSVSAGIPNVKVVRYTPNQGKGYAIKKGIDASSGSIHAQVDADSQFPPEELPILLKPILEGKADITFASRFIKGSSIQSGSLTRMRHLANFVVSSITSILAGQRYTDVNAGFKAWKSDAIKDIDIQCKHFAYEPEIAIMAKKRGYKIIETPVNYKGRQEGITNVKLIRDGIIIPLYLLRIKLFRK